MNFIVCDINGVIRRTGSTPASMFLQQATEEDEIVIEGIANDATQYVDQAGSVQDKMAMQATLAGSSIVGLPVPATIIIEGVRYQSDSGTVELSFNLPGTYSVRCEARYYLPKTFEVTA